MSPVKVQMKTMFLFCLFVFFFTVLRKENQLTRLQRKWDREMLIITVLEVLFELKLINLSSRWKANKLGILHRRSEQIANNSKAAVF